MPIDARIPLMTGSPPPPVARQTPAEAETEMLTLGDLRRTTRQQRTLDDAYAGALRPDGTVDLRSLGTTIVRGGAGSQLPAALQAQAATDTAQANVRRLSREEAAAELDTTSRVLASALQTPDGLSDANLRSLLSYARVDPARADEMMANIPPMGEARRAWAIQAGTLSDKALKALIDAAPTTDYQNTGSEYTPTQRNPLTGEVTVGGTATPAAGGAPAAGQPAAPQGAQMPPSIPINVSRADRFQAAQAAARDAANRRAQVEAARVKAERDAALQGLDINGNIIGGEAAGGPAPPGGAAAAPRRRRFQSLEDQVYRGELTEQQALTRMPAALREVFSDELTRTYPDFDPQLWATRRAARLAYGPSGPNGKAVLAQNNAIAHLGLLQELATALENDDTPLINRLKNRAARELGFSTPTDYQAALPLIAGEVTKIITSSGGALDDRLTAQHVFDQNYSPEQAAGAIRTTKEILGRQLENMRAQYEYSTGRTDFDRMLSADVRRATNEGGLVKIKDAAEYARLPSGTHYRPPGAPADGSGDRIKP